MNKGISRRNFLCGLAGLGASLYLPRSFAAQVQFQPFSFAHITDCHLAMGKPDSYRLTQEGQLFLQDAVKQINKLGVDFVIFGGDQVDQPGQDEKNWQLFVDIAHSLDSPWQFVLGETDVSGLVPVDKIKTYGRDWKGVGLAGDKPYWSTDILPGVHMIGLDTSRANSTEGFVSAEQLSWLQDDLRNAKNRFIMVVSHHPLLPPPPFDGGPPWDQYLVPQAPNVREVLNTSPDVRLALSGHVNVTKIDREKNIWYVASPSLVVYPCAFRVFRVNPERIDVETFGIEYPALVKKARLNLATSRLAYDYNNAKPALFIDIAYGDKLDNDASLLVAAGKKREPYKPEKVTTKKERPMRSAKNKPAAKGKPQEPEPVSSSAESSPAEAGKNEAAPLTGAPDQKDTDKPGSLPAKHD
jgi:3',5'-cyclic-AMP phosphodiesterase